MRTFYLVNQNGTRLNLNSANTGLLYDVSGLGTETERSYIGAGNDFWINSGNSFKQATITGTIAFKGSSHASNYKAFADFCEAATALYIAYTPDATEYLRKVELKFLSKGEDTWNHLIVSVSFNCLSPWYTTSVYTSLTTVTPAGQLPSAIEVTIASPSATTPVLSAEMAGGVKAFEAAMTASPNGAFTLGYCNIPGSGKYLVSGADALQNLDVSRNPFGLITAAATLTWKDGNGNAITPTSVSLKVYHFYRSI